MSIDQAIEALGLGLLATVNVGLWTLRVALTASGRRVAASMLAGVEAVLFALVFSSLMAALDDPVRIGGYAVGVAAGTMAGMVANDRLSPGHVLVTVVVDGDGRAASAALHARGWPTTATTAEGVRGQVTLLAVAVHDDAIARLRHDLVDAVEDAFVLVQPLDEIQPAVLPGGMHTGQRSHRRP